MRVSCDKLRRDILILGEAFMKKKLLMAAALALACVASVSAWEHTAGVEISAPFFSISAKGDGNKGVIEPQFTARYFGKAKNGFCVSATLGAGLPVSKDFALDGESKSKIGFGMGLALGAGYAFELNERFTLAALGSVSLDWLRFKYKKEISARTSTGSVSSEWTQSDNALFVGLGAELLAKFKLAKHISLMGSCAIRFLDGGTLWKSGTNQGKSYDATYDLRGNVIVTPSLGASWTF